MNEWIGGQNGSGPATIDRITLITSKQKTTECWCASKFSWCSDAHIFKQSSRLARLFGINALPCRKQFRVFCIRNDIIGELNQKQQMYRLEPSIKKVSRLCFHSRSCFSGILLFKLLCSHLGYHLFWCSRPCFMDDK